MKRIDIIYEDSDIVVCYKEAGVAVQTKNIRQMDMERLLLNELSKRGEKPQIHIVHRLDQPVEGIVVFAKNKNAAASLCRQLQDNQMTKEYLAVVNNGFADKETHLEDYLLKNQADNCSEVSDASHKGAKLAILDVTVVSGIKDKQLVEVHLKTGRHHQIRVQLSNAGCPIVGDTKYNPRYVNQKGFHQIALCAHKLDFIHPSTGNRVSFNVTPLGKDFQQFNLIR